jgi:hypothetical protein
LIGTVGCDDAKNDVLHPATGARPARNGFPPRSCGRESAASVRRPTLPPRGLATWRRLVLRSFDASASRRTAASVLVWSHTTSGDGHGQILGGLGARCTRNCSGAAVHRLQVTWAPLADRLRAIVVATARRSCRRELGAIDSPQTSAWAGAPHHLSHCRRRSSQHLRGEPWRSTESSSSRACRRRSSGGGRQRLSNERRRSERAAGNPVPAARAGVQASTALLFWIASRRSRQRHRQQLPDGQ